MNTVGIYTTYEGPCLDGEAQINKKLVVLFPDPVRAFLGESGLVKQGPSGFIPESEGFQVEGNDRDSQEIIVSGSRRTINCEE